MEKRNWKFSVGDPVYVIKDDEGDVIENREVIHGMKYYRLRYACRTVHEDALLGSQDFKLPDPSKQIAFF